jgi:hypothetical protein
MCNWLAAHAGWKARTELKNSPLAWLLFRIASALPSSGNVKHLVMISTVMFDVKEVWEEITMAGRLTGLKPPAPAEASVNYQPAVRMARQHSIRSSAG